MCHGSWSNPKRENWKIVSGYYNLSNEGNETSTPFSLYPSNWTSFYFINYSHCRTGVTFTDTMVVKILKLNSM